MRTSKGYIFQVDDGWLRFRQRTTHTGTHVDMDVVIDPYDATFSSISHLVGRIRDVAHNRGLDWKAIPIARSMSITHEDGRPISHELSSKHG